MWDRDGNEYLDAYNNVVSVGHAHPQVVAAISDQLGTLCTHTRYLQSGILDFAEELLASFGGSLSSDGHAMFTCTGSEANDLALRLAHDPAYRAGVSTQLLQHHDRLFEDPAAVRELEELDIPRFLFLNKIDKADAKVMEALHILQPASRKPLVMRQLPTFSNGIVNGFVDLALERVHIYREHAPSEVVPLEGENLDRSKDARFSMLEKLADHDDELMEQLLADIPPPRDKVFDDLAKEVRDGDVCPVLLGCATRTNGVLRLMKALRHMPIWLRIALTDFRHALSTHVAAIVI